MLKTLQRRVFCPSHISNWSLRVWSTPHYPLRPNTANAKADQGMSKKVNVGGKPNLHVADTPSKKQEKQNHAIFTKIIPGYPDVKVLVQTLPNNYL